MSQGTEHHLEEAEHAKHAQHHPFDKRVALSMAIVAAALASVTLLSHRSHGEVQVKKTEESDAWNYFQAKKNRGYMYAADAQMLEALSKDAPDSETGKKTALLVKKWKEDAATYEEDAKKKEELANDLKHEGQVAHDGSNFFDLGELGIELSLVLCSVAMLARNKLFWIAGIVIGVLGFAVAMCGFLSEPILQLFRQLGAMR
jgi:hypothetical protein